MKKIVLIDGSGFIYRAFFALPPLTRSDNTPIGAVFGFANMLLSMLENNSMDYFAIIFDKSKKNFRHDMYPQYKQNRRETPDELKPQFKIIRLLCDAFNVPYIEEENYEADDLIAAYTKHALEMGFKVKIVSGDKDLIQLIKENVELYDPLKAKDITEAEVIKKYGIHPYQMIDFLALCGDASDNIPGVESVGPKTAAALLNQCGDLTNIYEYVEKLDNKKKVHEKLLLNRELAFLSKTLATVNENAPINIDLEDLKIRPVDIAKAKNFLEEQEFNSLLHKLNNLHHILIPNTNQISIEELMQLAEKEKYLCITSKSIKVNNDEILNYDKHNNALISILKNPDVLKITNNAKELMYLTDKLENYEDLSIISFLINGKDASFSISNESYKFLLDKLKNNNQYENYINIEKPMIKILFEIEKNGFLIDQERLKHLTLFFNKLQNTIKENIFILSNKDINLDSPKQVSDLLFNHLKIKYFKRNKKTGTISTNQEVLEELANAGYEIAEHLLEWRQISKLNSTYTNALINKISESTGRIHTTFNITSTNTGRLSSSDPNLQNIPIKTNIGRKIRSAFIAAPGNSLISMDYSQIELRVLAHLSSCPKLLNAFQNGDDIHSITASELFQIKLSEVTDELRRKAKTINFGIIYGMSAFGLSKRVRMSNKESEEFVKNYFIKYPKIKEYIDYITKYAKENGYVKTILGRTCFINNINSSNFNLRKFAIRQAINAPIQGSSADIMKLAMINIKKNKNIKAKIIMQIHDELIFEVNSDISESQANLIRKEMEINNLINCPLKVNTSIGTNWSEL